MGVEFHRSASVPLLARRATAVLTGTFIDAAVDDDNDGLYDAILVSPAVTVAESATYLVNVKLRSASGKTMSATTVTELSPGMASPAVRFDADRSRRS